MAGPAAALGIDVVANITEAQAALAKVQAQLEATAATSESAAAKSAAAWTAAGKKMQTVGKSMTKYITVPAVAAGAVAVKLAMDFDKSMALIQTQAGASASEVKKLSQEVLDFAKSGKTQFSPNELAQALYSIESAGIHGAKAMDTLRASAKLATVGQSDLASTTKALAAAQKTGIKGSGDLKKAIGTLNASVGQGQMHMDDLVSAMGTGFLSTAAQMGLSLKDVGGALAELTKQGMPATQSATRLRMTFSLMAAPTAAAADALKGIGLQADDLANTMRQQGLLPALQMLQDHLDGLSKTAQTQVLSAAFGGGRTSAAILALVNNTGDLDTILQNIKKHSGEVNDSFKKMQEEPSVRLERVWSQMQAVLIDMGNKLIPKLIPLVQKVASVLETVITAFTGAPSWVQDFLIGAVVLGPFIRGLGMVARAYGAIKLAATGAAVAEGAAGAAGGVGAAGAAGGAAAAERGAVGALTLNATTVLFAAGAGAALGIALDKVFPQGIIPRLDPNKAPHTPREWQNIITLGVDDAKISKDVGPRAHGADQPAFRPASSEPGPAAGPDTTRAADVAAHARDQFNAAKADVAALINLSKISDKTITGIVDGLVKKYGSLAVAATNMSRTQAHDFLSLAVSAKLPKSELIDLAQSFAKAGKLSGQDMQDLAKITGLSMNKLQGAMGDSIGGIHRFTGTIDSIKNWSQDTVGAFKKAAKPIGDGTQKATQQGATAIHQFTGTISSIKQWSSDTVHAFVSASKASAKGTTAIKDNANSALKGLGVGKTIDFSTFTLQGTPGAHQKGGRIVPGKGTGDIVPAMLEPGEFVLNREAVQGIGAARLDAMNKAMPRFQKGGPVGGMTAMVNETNKFESHHFPYSWGGGHSGFGIQPVDCSGFVSDVLHAGGLLNAPMVSGALMNWGKAGTGPLTVYASPVHTVLSLNGRFAGTSGSNPGGGAGWIEGGSPGLVSGGVARTMDVIGGVAEKIKRQIIKGPKGALGAAAQMGLDHVWEAANAYIAKHMPSGAFGGGQAMADLGTKGWHRTGATAEGLDGQRGAYGTVGGMGFAELLLAGANAGMHPNLEDIIGAHVPPMGKVGFQYNGKQAIAVKNDIGSGQAGNPHYTVDIQTGLGNALGWHPNADVDVKRLQGGGLVQKLIGGGGVANKKGSRLSRFLKRFGQVNKAQKRKHQLDEYVEYLKEIGGSEKMVKKIKEMDKQWQDYADFASRAESIGPGVKIPGDGMKLTQSGWLGKELETLWSLRNMLVKADEHLKERQKHLKNLLKEAQKKAKDLKKSMKETAKRIDKLKKGRKLSDGDIKHLKNNVTEAQKRIKELSGKKHLSPHQKKELEALQAQVKSWQAGIKDGRLTTVGRQKLLDSLSESQDARQIRAGALPKIEAAIKAQSQKVGGALGDTSTLDDIQGRGSTRTPSPPLPKLIMPVDTRFGGELLNVQLSLKDVAAGPLSGLDISGLERFAELIRLGAFKTDPFGTIPTFHQGGTYRAPRVGGEGLALLKDRETIIPAGGDGNVNVSVVMYADEDRAMVDVNGKQFETAVERIHRKSSRNRDRAVQRGVKYGA